MVIGITGKYAAGKSYLANYILTKLHDTMPFTLISVDKIGHLALVHQAEHIVEAFGKSIIDTSADNSSTVLPTIHRKALGAIVFNDAKKLSQLEEIVHPWMKSHIENIVKDSPNNYIIDAAILHRLKLDSLCTITIVVHSAWVIRLYRAFFRDKLSIKSIIQRFSSQALVPDKRHFRKKYSIQEIALNSTHNSTDLLVNGTCNSKRLDTLVSKIVNGESNGTI